MAEPDALFTVEVEPPKPPKGRPAPAASNPVARVYVDVPLAHLDRTYDYLVPARFDADAVPGCRVRVRFAGQLVDAYLVERGTETEHKGTLAFLDRVTSPEPVLAPEVATLCRAVADRYAGTMIDVLRLAIPPRHARVESEGPPTPAEPPPMPTAEGWSRYPRGAAFLDALRSGRQAHAVWQALPGEDWPARLAEVAVTAAAAGRGAAVVVPDHRDVARVHAACAELAGADAVVALSADLGPAKRYRNWLTVRRGGVRIVVGTRATAYAPVDDPGVLVVWDDGDDQHSDPRSPYPHVRDVLMQRASLCGAALLVGGFARTAEAQVLVDSGWAPEIIATRDTVRATAPRVTAIGEHDSQLARDPAARTARVPSMAFEAARTALNAGHPVLVQVPRRGYVPALTCQDCRTPARCRRCAGPLAVPAGPTQESRHPRREDASRRRSGAIGRGRGPGEHTDSGSSSRDPGSPADERYAAGGANRGSGAGSHPDAAGVSGSPADARRFAADGPGRGSAGAYRAEPSAATRPSSAVHAALPESAAARPPACRWCAATEANFRCQNCGSRRLRAVVVGAKRTAEELGRAFSGFPVRTSGAAEVLSTVDSQPALIVATPGAEPVADGGYGAALLLDGWSLLGRADLRATEEALRRWMTAAALVRPAADGGRVVVLAESALPAVQALVRWDPAWHATVELTARAELAFPPAVRMASVDGPPAAVDRFLTDLPLPPTAQILGPVPLGIPDTDGDTPRERALIRVDRAHGRDLATVLAQAQAVRTARKDPDPLRVQLDPLDLI
ncbi:primosomal protein N' [Actinokineospora enzanensis]|uniref:primosomal protein N' n=1 Tax=Actinokineospora enzanensis TaxID=155975 RepID=UPI0003672461|nr:primosomal protein N' [Actinokineospora enzanensis]